MSIGPLGGLAASAAGTPIAQTKGSEPDQVQQGASAQRRKTQNDQKAEMAAGVGQADGEDHHTGQRDADGRRLWENTSGPGPQTAADQRPPADSPSGKDPTGQSGSQLDLTG
ncbi:MAG: hypothetical protein PHO07_21060 [Pirellulales bacterium]|jgi:hypothetical protein|nr:hypothetical protein [Thermoguttaceae bacterium]MDD4789667.1 hypothetical protein [Pirellulales bacterium]MDI9443762.1 hypothetical protein [Planctomycetota bacterium]